MDLEYVFLMKKTSHTQERQTSLKEIRLTEYIEIPKTSTETKFSRRIYRSPNGYKVVSVTLDPGVTDLHVIGLGDLHYGHRSYNHEVLKKVLAFIEQNKQNTAVLGFGDLIENSTKTSVGSGVYEQVINPQQQKDDISEMFSPFKDNIVGLIHGNHEDRTTIVSGMNPMQDIASNLHVPYLGSEMFVMFRKARDAMSHGRNYTLYGVHSKSTSKTTALAEHAVDRDWMKWLDFDIIAKAHGHDMTFSDPYIRLGIDTSNTCVRESLYYIWFIGHYLNRPDSYNADVPRRPKRLGTIGLTLHFSTRHKKITPFYLGD
jgi:hypothetical protein